MSVTTLIGLRYTRSRSDNRFLSLVSIVSFLGLVLGVTALVVVIAVMNGFDRELKQRILGAAPHQLVAHQEPEDVSGWLDGYPVATVSPFQESQMLLSTGTDNRLVAVFGIEPEAEAGSLLAGAVVQGALSDLQKSAGVPGVPVILGDPVARYLGLRTGDRLQLVSPRLSAGGRLLKPQLTTASLVGTFSLGSELDYNLALMHLDDLVAMTGKPVGLKVMYDDIFAVRSASRKLEAQGLKVQDWTGRYGDFFDAVRMEKIMMFVLLSFVVAIASFSIVAGLSMLVDSKRRDIAVLRTMGMSEVAVMRVFLVQGVVIALSGVGAGLVLGVPLAYNIPEVMSWIQALSGFSIVEGTFFDRIPTDVRILDTLVISLVAFVISFLATLYPSFRAARMDPAAILRYE